tara:strand:+ start:139 stop:633 length:495 start_codon:yes stop_codon:yes gene_type:complete
MKINKIKEFSSNFEEIDKSVKHEISTLLNDSSISLIDYGDTVGRGRKKGVTPLRNRILALFEEAGWLQNVEIFINRRESIYLLKNNIALQFSFGNYAQGYFDILKLKQAHHTGLSENNILVSLNSSSVNEYKISGNLVDFDRITTHHSFFNEFLSFPIVFLELK